MTQAFTAPNHEILDRQLSEGNAGAQAYFMKRVDMMLGNDEEDRLVRFMTRFWPQFSAGIKKRTQERFAARAAADEQSVTEPSSK